MENVKHYGKSLNKLTSNERRLLDTDLQLLDIFRDIKKSEKNSVENVVLISASEFFIEKRGKICCELLGIELSGDDSDIDHLVQIESTQYSFGKFLQDLHKNNEYMKKFEHTFSLN